jgi:hypothetical protein
VAKFTEQSVLNGYGLNFFLLSLYDVHEMNEFWVVHVCLSMIQVENRPKVLDEIWY